MLYVILLVLLIFLSSFFSGSETALMSVSDARIDYLVHKKRKNAKLLKNLRKNKERLLTTILFGNNVVNIGASALATKLALDFFGNSGVAIATGVMTFVLLIFSEITPKSYAAHHSEKVALRISPLISFLEKIFFPFILVIEYIMRIMKPLIGSTSLTTVISEDEIQNIVETSEEKGAINKFEKEVITNVFRFDDLLVEDIMIPRHQIFSLEGNKKIKDVIDIIVKKGFSRIPVYEKNKDNIIGALYVKDIPKYDNDVFIKDVVREIMVVPITKKSDELFREMRKSRKHMAIVVDEYGMLAGLVTIEDLIEEIVGEIYDETDEVSRSIVKVDNKEYLIRGDTEIRQIKKRLKLLLSKKDLETISSIILEKLGRIPKEGEIITIKKHKLKIEKMIKNRIELIRLMK